MQVTWMSKKQNVLVLSTAKAEYREKAELLQRAVCTQTLETSFKNNQTKIKLENNNIPENTMIDEIEATKTSKFMDMCHAYI